MAEKRQKGKRWLETHIWHAKRSKMIDIWGHRLTLKPNEKCLRSSFTASLSGVTIHDASYHQVLEFSGSPSQMSSFLDQFDGDRSMSFFVFNLYSSETLNLICPVSAVLDTSEITSSLCWMIVHPSASELALVDLTKRSAVHGISLTDLSGLVNIFEFSGSQTFTTLQRVLLPVEGELQKKELSSLLVEDPRFSFPQKEDYDEVRESLDMRTGVKRDRSIWNAELRVKCVELRKSDKHIDDLRGQNIIPGQSLSPSQGDPFVPVLVIPFPQQTLLLLPKDWGRPFWRSFIFSKARFAGLEQVRRNREEIGLPVFPYDYPGTAAYDAYAEIVAKELEEVYNKKPPGKRVNYAKFGITSPFKPPFHPNSWLIPSPVLTSFLVESKGVTQHLPALWRSLRPGVPVDFTGALVMGEIVLTGRGSPDYNAVILDETGERIIGYMTMGCFSLSKGCGAGFGACYANFVAPLLKASQAIEDQLVLVQVRNTNSDIKRPATFRILKLS